MSPIGSFTLIKNEAAFIGAHLEMWLPHLSEMVFFDGNSTDGTLQIILDVIHNHPLGHKIRLFTDKDPKDLKGDYVRLFDECLKSVESDLAFFLHPDMIPAAVPLNFDHLESATAASVGMRSFGGEPDGQLYEINGRGPVWKNIYRRRNPDLGAHYWGAYGAVNEDVYFSAITGDKHVMMGDISKYPYTVVASGLEVLHFSDVRPHARRVSRMVKCLLNNDCSPEEADYRANRHPRVTLKDGVDVCSGAKVSFTPAEYPAEMLAARAKYAHLERRAVAVA